MTRGLKDFGGFMVIRTTEHWYRDGNARLSRAERRAYVSGETIQNKHLINEARSCINYLLQEKKMTLSTISDFTGFARISISLFLRGRIDLERLAIKVMELKKLMDEISIEELAWQVNQ
jgi:hypothetical protein